jgi:hypothetical protein
MFYVYLKSFSPFASDKDYRNTITCTSTGTRPRNLDYYVVPRYVPPTTNKKSKSSPKIPDFIIGGSLIFNQLRPPTEDESKR